MRRAVVSFMRLSGFGLLAMTISATVARGDDWPQWLGPKRDGVWRETGIVSKLPANGPKVLWRVPVAEGYSGPAVAGGKIYVTDWIRDPKAIPPKSPFVRPKGLAGRERVLCLDEHSGKTIWEHAYECPYTVSYAAGPRCTPTIAGGKVYTLGSEGHLLCLDAESGKVVWSKNFTGGFGAKVPLWGFAAHPLLDGDKLICLVGGDNDSLVVAFHKDTGKEIWRSLAAREPGYCPPVIIEAGGTRQLIIWYPDAVCSLNPETGKLYWSQPFESRAALSIPTPRLAGDRLFITAFYNGPLMLQLANDKPAARVLWKGRSNSERNTDGLHSIMTTPFIKDGYIYGVCSYGQLRCLRVTTGERIWETFAPTSGKEERWGHAFIVAHDDRFFLFNERGQLIIANLTPDGYKEISRAQILEPTNQLVNRPVVWMHPAFANRCMVARNDKEIVRVSLAAE
jgi:outer membrane protein assembly factor BamB